MSHTNISLAILLLTVSIPFFYQLWRAKRENPLTNVPLNEVPDQNPLYWEDDSEESMPEANPESDQEQTSINAETTDMLPDAKNKNLFINPKGDKTKTAILFGTNKCDPKVYQGETLTLRGCVNDVMTSKALAIANGYRQIYLFTDASATIGNFLATWANVRAGLTEGDTLLVQRSGHGMSIDENLLDKLGDKETGGTNQDGTVYSGDQGAVLHDGVIIDDVYWRLLLTLPKVKVIWINDSCHSATQYRLMSGIRSGNAYRKAKSVSKEYMPSEDNVLDLVQLDKLVPKPKNTELICTLVSVSGCQDYEYSADAYVDGKYQGALTAMLASVLKTAPKSTPEQLKVTLAEALKKRGFEQNPQINIEGNQEAWKQPLL